MASTFALSNRSPSIPLSKYSSRSVSVCPFMTTTTPFTSLGPVINMQSIRVGDDDSTLFSIQSRAYPLSRYHSIQDVKLAGLRGGLSIRRNLSNLSNFDSLCASGLIFHSSAKPLFNQQYVFPKLTTFVEIICSFRYLIPFYSLTRDHLNTV